MGKIRAIKPRIVIDWPDGRDAEVRVFSLAPTIEEANRLEQIVKRAFKCEVKDSEK